MTDAQRANHRKLVAMRQTLRQARDLWEKSDFSGARRLLDQVGAYLEETGQRSAAYDGAMGVTLDYADDEELSMAHLEKAQAADPLSLEVDRSIETVLENARRSLARGDLPLDSPRIALLYGVLHRRDEADRASHLLFARHQLATGRASEARSLLEAMTRLYYPAPDLYELVAVCAESLGDATGAARARAEVERLGGAEAVEVASAESKLVIEKGSRRQRARPS